MGPYGWRSESTLVINKKCVDFWETERFWLSPFIREGVINQKTVFGVKLNLLPWVNRKLLTSATAF